MAPRRPGFDYRGFSRWKESFSLEHHIEELQRLCRQHNLSLELKIRCPRTGYRVTADSRNREVVREISAAIVKPLEKEDAT